MNSPKNSSFPLFTQKRRHFLKNISIGSGGILLSPAFSSCSEKYESELYKSFLDPSAQSKPFLRWWWNGNRLTKDELSRELELMYKAGIGGIEINPIKMPEQAENLVGEAYEWLSDEWIEFLEFAIQKADSLGMVTDLIVGTGWPFGGEFLLPEETIQGLKVEVISLEGPAKEEIPLPTSEDSSNFSIKNVTLFPLQISGLTDGIEIPFDEKDTSITIDIPSGKYELHILTWQNNFRQVMHGAPGGAGPVLDHFNKAAVEKYLNQMSDRIKQKTGKDSLEGIRAMFCDSIELNGANWTHGFETHFNDKRGYDITPYLPLLLKKELNLDLEFEDELKRARFDYSQTLAELFMDSFIKPFHEWCHQNGTLSRYQAYGHPWLYTDLIDGSLVPDIPEGDQWLFNGGWQPYADIDQIRYAIWNKYASSAGHLAKRKITSTEAMTNTSGVFKASLKYIKQATDLNIATGINHQVLHGFNYSPPEAGFPGWIRYGCYFNENNPWWQYMHIWSQYSSRLSEVLQKSESISQVAIMGPTLDIWSDHGLDRNPFNLEPWYLHSLWQALSHLGFCSDYVNGKLLKSARLESGNILLGSMKYEVLLLCEIETMESEVARKIEELTNQGARIVMIGKQPLRSPNMVSAPKNDGIVKKSIENALNSGILVAASPDKRLQKTPDLLMNWADQLMKNSGLFPLLEISKPSPQLFHIQQKSEHADIVFLANVDRKNEFVSEISIGEKNASATIWDPETGIKQRLRVNKNDRIDISLKPLESMLIVADPMENLIGRSPNSRGSSQSNYILDSPWDLKLKDAENHEEPLTLDQLEPINSINGFQNFGGEIIYKTQFILKRSNFRTLTIDEVYETAHVTLNGEDLGLSWWGNNSFDIKGKLKKGKNKLEIKVTTLLTNYVSSLKENKTAQIWTSKYKEKTPVKCGLVGKVTLL